MCFELQTQCHVMVSRQQAYDYQSLGNLPEFALKGWQQLRNKQANLTFRVSVEANAFSQCLLYFDHGQQYIQETLVLLHVKPDGWVEATVNFPASLQSIRVVPVVAGLFSITDFKVNVIGLVDSQAASVDLAETPECQFSVTDNNGHDLSYAKWISLNELPAEKYQRLSERSKEWPIRPLISIVMPTYNTNKAFLIEAIESVRAQTYDHWQLCIADDASTVTHVKAVLDHYSAIDNRINVVYLKQNSHICESTNAAIALAQGSYMGFLDHDDALHPTALHCVAEVINTHQNAALIYSDEDKILADGTRLNPYFKCDFNYDLFLSQNMICHFGVYKASIVKSLGGMRENYDGSQDYDLALRVMDFAGEKNLIHIPRVLYHWRLHNESTSVSFEAKPYAQTAAVRAVQAHLDRNGIAAQVEQDKALPAYQRVRYPLPTSTRRNVEIIIVFNGDTQRLEQSISSIITHTHQLDYQISIIDQTKSDQDSPHVLSQLCQQTIVSVVHFETSQSHEEVINKVALASKADFICLLHSSIEIKQSGWLTEMVALADRADVGCVGAKLLSQDHCIAHAGIVLSEPAAAYAYQGEHQKHAGYFSRLGLLSAYSAVSADCMVVACEAYQKLSGFDEQLRHEFSAIDFCLRLTQLGYRNVCTPYVQIYQHQRILERYNSPLIEEEGLDWEKMRIRWGAQLNSDPFYSPNLNAERADFSYAWPTRVPDLLSD